MSEQPPMTLYMLHLNLHAKYEKDRVDSILLRYKVYIQSPKGKVQIHQIFRCERFDLQTHIYQTYYYARKPRTNLQD